MECFFMVLLNWVPQESEPVEPAKKKGRPVGSKNKPKPVTAIVENKTTNKKPKSRNAGVYGVIKGGEYHMGQTKIIIKDNDSMGVEDLRVYIQLPLRDGGLETYVIHAKYASIYAPRTQEELKVLNPTLTEEQLKRRKSSTMYATELGGYIENEDGTNNIEDLIGTRVKDWSQGNIVG